MKTLLALASAAALTAAVALPAQANGYYQPQGAATNNVNVKQNGNGCRNRCYGTQNFNAGVNNGNFSGNNGNHHGQANNVNVKQNGNGCRNRCYGTQSFNAGVNNGNKNKGGH